jgi:hypothetical protein
MAMLSKNDSSLFNLNKRFDAANQINTINAIDKIKPHLEKTPLSHHKSKKIEN